VKIDVNSGLLREALYLPSPHRNARPSAMAIDVVVVHGISLPPAEFGTGAVERFFCGKLDHTEHAYFDTIKELKVSAHLFISREGVITQFVPFHERAWHAGVSIFKGKSGCNDFSVGIELEGTDELPYEQIQYQQLALVLQALQEAYPLITRERVVGHSDVAPGRKTDPGASFDWAHLDCLLNSCSA
jgi:AmpD protein